MECATTSCKHNLYPIVIGTFASFAWIFVFDLVTYVGPLAQSYAALKPIQIDAEARAMNEIWFPVFELMLAISVTAFYYCWRHKSEGRPSMLVRAKRYHDGLGFGGFVGLFMGISMAGLYVSLDIPGISPLLWIAAGLVKGLVLGILLTALHPKPTASNA